MKAWELLDSEEKWCKGAYARDGNYRSVCATSARAVQWCARGAIEKCYDNPITESSRVMLLSGELEPGNQGPLRITIIDWNDSSDYQEVYNKLKELDI